MNQQRRIIPQDIEDNIVSEWYFTARDGVQGAAPSDCNDGPVPDTLRLLTFCVLVLQNGFKVTGESACVHPATFDAATGRRLARENAENKIWPLMGYELQTKLQTP